MNRLHITRATMLALAVALSAAGVAWATPGAGAVGTILARGNLAAGVKVYNDALKLKVSEDIDVVTQTVTIAPGGHTGWHSHPGPVFVTITAGTLTFYDGDDPTCSPVLYQTGDTFVDQGAGHVHIARNEGPTDLVLFATYLVPDGAALRTDEASPGNCDF